MRRAGPCPGTPRAPPRAPRGSPCRGGSSARRRRGSSRRTRRRAPARAACVRRPTARRRASRARSSRRRGNGRAASARRGAAGPSRAGRIAAPIRACRAPSPAARSTPARRRGRGVRSRRRHRAARGSSRAAWSCPIRSDRRVRRARRARSRSSRPSSSTRSPIRSARPSASRTVRPLRAGFRNSKPRLLVLRVSRSISPFDFARSFSRRSIWVSFTCALRAIFSRRGAEARDESLQSLDVAADPLGGLRRGVKARRLLETPGVPGALEVRRASRVELEHHVRDGLEEPAVVRDDHDPGVERLQLALQPLQAFDVEMVRRLVEQQEIRIAAERARQRRARELAARERLELAVELLVGEAEARARRRSRARASRSRRHARAGPAPPRTANRGVVVISGRHRLLEAPELLLQRDQVAGSGEHVVAQRQAPLERRALVVQGDPRSLLEGELTALEVRLADERAQQGGLAGPVWPGQRDAVAALDLERHAVEQRVAGELLAEVGCDQDCHCAEGSRLRSSERARYRRPVSSRSFSHSTSARPRSARTASTERPPKRMSPRAASTRGRSTPDRLVAHRARRSRKREAPSGVEAVGTSCFGHSLLALDRAGPAVDADSLLARHALGRRSRRPLAPSRWRCGACPHRLPDPHELLAGEAGVAGAGAAGRVSLRAPLRLVLRLPVRTAARTRGRSGHLDGICRPGLVDLQTRERGMRSSSRRSASTPSVCPRSRMRRSTAGTRRCSTARAPTSARAA